MKPGRLPATPDLMALLCLIGGAVREAEDRNLLMHLLLLGTVCPPLGHVLRLWIEAERAYSTTEFEYERHAGEDGDGGPDEFRPGWMTREGPVLLWRHVNRFGQALLIPMQWNSMLRAAPRLTPEPVWLAGWVLSPLSQNKYFLPV